MSTIRVNHETHKTPLRTKKEKEEISQNITNKLHKYSTKYSLSLYIYEIILYKRLFSLSLSCINIMLRLKPNFNK